MRFLILSSLFVALLRGTHQNWDQTRKEMQSAELDLRRELLSTYSRNMELPKMQPNSTVTVPIMMIYTFSKLVELNERDEQLSVMAYAEVKWTDERLKWDSDRVGVYSMVFDLSDIWFPDIIFANSVHTTTRLLTKDKDVARVFSRGLVEWTGTLLLTSPCEMDVTNFPLDIQVCEQLFRLEPRTYDPKLLGVNALSNDYDRFNVKFYQDSSWDINVTSDIAVTNPGQYENTVTLTLTLRRKYQYYLNRILAPITLFSVLVLFVFLIPPDAGEKLSLGVTLLLTFSVFQMMIDEDLPASSTSTPLVTTAMVLLQVCSAFSIAASVLVLNLHHLNTDHGRGKLPPVLRFIFFNILATLTCYCSKVKELKRSDANKVKELTRSATNKAYEQEEETTDKTNISNEASVLEEIRTLLRELPDKLKDEPETSEWKVAALIADRLLMFLCLLIIVSVYVHLMVTLQRTLSEQMGANDSHVAENKETYYYLLRIIHP